MLTLSVRSFQVPETPCTMACPPSFPSVPTSRATRVTSAANARRRSTITFTVSLSSRISPLASTVIFCDRSPLATAVVTIAVWQSGVERWPEGRVTVGGEEVHVLGEVLPGAGDGGDLGLPAELPLDADLARDGGDLLREQAEVAGHVVDGVGERGDLSLGLEDELLRQIAVGDRCDHLH